MIDMDELMARIAAAIAAGPLRAVNVRVEKLQQGYDIERDVESVRVELTYDVDRGAMIAEPASKDKQWPESVLERMRNEPVLPVDNKQLPPFVWSEPKKPDAD